MTDIDLRAVVVAALEPFSEEAERWNGYPDSEPLVEGWTGGPDSDLNVGHLRAAKKALEGLEAAIRESSGPAGRPITPGEVPERKSKEIPEFVFDAFNHFIALKYVDGSAVIRQSDVWDMVKIKAKIHGRSEELTTDWLNVEEAYRAAGWKVSYDRPAYNENYPATFTFDRK